MEVPILSGNEGVNTTLSEADVVGFTKFHVATVVPEGIISEHDPSLEAVPEITFRKPSKVTEVSQKVAAPVVVLVVTIVAPVPVVATVAPALT